MTQGIRRLPSLNGLRVFDVVTRHLNFRIAAEELGVTQGAVAQQIRGLEAELGLKLFDRQPRALALTEAGRSYGANIRRAFELISQATETLRPEPLPLTISVTPTFASKWLLRRLADFTATHPDIDLRIVATERIANFQTDAVDLAVRYGRPPFGAGLLADLLFEEALVAVGSPFLVEKLGHSEETGNLGHVPLLHDAHDVWPQFLERAFPAGVSTPLRNIRFNQTSLAIDAAIAGQGLALASAFFVEDDIAAGRLMRLSPVSIRTESNFYVVAPKKPRHVGPVASVRQWLLAAAGRSSPI